MNIKTASGNFFRYFYSITTLLIIILLLYVFFLPHENILFDQDECISFNENWILTDHNEQEHLYDFPSEVENNIPNGYVISNTLPSNLSPRFNSFAKFCVFQNITIRIDGSIIYQTNDTYINDRHYDKNPSAYWIIFSLPENYAGKKITVEVTSPYEDYQNTSGSTYIGSRSSIIFHIVKVQLPKFILSVTFFIFGFVFILLYLIFHKKTHIPKSFFYISFFIFWTGLWLFAETGIFQIFISNPIFINSLSFISLMMMVLSFIRYYISLNCAHFVILQRIILYTLYLYIFSACLLQFFNVFDFYESIYIIHVLIFVTLCIMCMSIFSEVYIYKNKRLSYMMYCIFILSFCGLLELYSFHCKDHSNTGTYFSIGLLVCIFFITIKEFKKTIQIIKLNQEAKYYRKLAMIDFMTGCSNRTAYGEYLNKMQLVFSAETTFAAIMCDMNNLKKINDNFGHEMGDQAIIKCGEILKENLSDIAHIYRIGGDEFIAIIESPVTIENVEKRIDILNYECINADHKFSFHFSVSFGYAIHDSKKDASIEDVIRRADENMYYNKKINKAKYENK